MKIETKKLTWFNPNCGVFSLVVASMDPANTVLGHHLNADGMPNEVIDTAADVCDPKSSSNSEMRNKHYDSIISQDQSETHDTDSEMQPVGFQPIGLCTDTLQQRGVPSSTNLTVTRETTALLPNMSVQKPTSFLHYGSLLLENKGSVARDHLASERTYLAWLRTSISLASVGVGVAQLLKLSDTDSNTKIMLRVSKGLGLCFILIAFITLSIGTSRYFTIQKLLTVDQFPVSRLGIGFVMTTVLLMVIAVFVIVMTM